MRYAHLSEETLLDASNVTSLVINHFDACGASETKSCQKRAVSVSRGLGEVDGPVIMQKGVKHRPVRNILAGMITEEQRIADEKCFIEYFDYLEGLGKRDAA